MVQPAEHVVQNALETVMSLWWGLTAFEKAAGAKNLRLGQIIIIITIIILMRGSYLTFTLSCYRRL